MAHKLREALLWIGATLGVICLAWTAAMFAFGLTPLVFTSGSMSPVIGAGDLAFARTVDAREIDVDDVVSVINDRGIRVTHRVTHVDQQDDGTAILQMKGDANQSPDEEEYRVEEAERVMFSVPRAGYVVEAVGSPLGMFLGGLLVAGVLFIAFRNRPDDDEGDDPSHPVVDQSKPQPSPPGT